MESYLCHLLPDGRHQHRLREQNAPHKLEAHKGVAGDVWTVNGFSQRAAGHGMIVSGNVILAKPILHVAKVGIDGSGSPKVVVRAAVVALVHTELCRVTIPRP